ncbi:signal transduction histidine kinase [Novosphingobium sp. PhB55]|uniref:sensor histidine kinase n=1 Tax=Novosphingobium sp. PhB55 TaxID=2485106 RepID=UPI0010659F8B|nr:ATP-binding protein [Novosphingobium sp. PhB55]TDW67567.1 signal transduction histidine kinase [Novosphingobium sp. PhB55]
MSMPRSAISDHKAVASTQQLRSEQAALRSHALPIMIGGMTHELRNRVQLLTSTIDILKSAARLEPDEIASVIDDAAEGVSQIGRMVRAFLQFAAPEARTDETVDLCTLLESCQRRLQWLVKDNVTLAVHAAPDLPNLRCNPCRLENVIVDLVLNADSAIAERGLIVIAAKRTAADSIMLEVADSGTGMTREVQAQACEAYFTTKLDGTGLGLVNVHRFARDLDGALTIDSHHGEGTTIRLILPAERIEPDVRRNDEWLDQALADSFPASDPLPY